MFEPADLVHERGMFHQVGWRRGVVDVGIGNCRDEFPGGVLLVVAQLQALPDPVSSDTR
jgi:hypothetical protein